MTWQDIVEGTTYGGFIAIILAMIFRIAQLFGIEHLWSGIPIVND